MAMRPLEKLPTIRAKLGSVIVFAVAVTLLVSFVLIAFYLRNSPRDTEEIAALGLAGKAALGELSATFGFLQSAWWQFLLAGAVAGFISLLLARWLARGMTQPLRDMAAAARRMEVGDYSVRVRARSRDEVGQLAAAFNRMTAELEDLDRSRRDLVANLSHE